MQVLRRLKAKRLIKLGTIRQFRSKYLQILFRKKIGVLMWPNPSDSQSKLISNKIKDAKVYPKI